MLGTRVTICLFLAFGVLCGIEKCVRKKLAYSLHEFDPVMSAFVATCNIPPSVPIIPSLYPFGDWQRLKAYERHVPHLSRTLVLYIMNPDDPRGVRSAQYSLTNAAA